MRSPDSKSKNNQSIVKLSYIESKNSCSLLMTAGVLGDSPQGSHSSLMTSEGRLLTVVPPSFTS